MVSIFWVVQGINFIDYLENGKRVTKKVSIKKVIGTFEGRSLEKVKEEEYFFNRTLRCITYKKKKEKKNDDKMA